MARVASTYPAQAPRSDAAPKPRPMWMRLLWMLLFDRYHPERHYMRGPGPKWREKHRR